FLSIPAREVALYAYLHVEGFEIRQCPHSHNALINDVHSLLNDYTWRHPSTKYAIVNLSEQLVSYGFMPGTHADICPVRGESDLSEYRPCRML
nr:tRNA(Ile)-lysidine synthase [Methanoregulaceae archaeon]